MRVNMDIVDSKQFILEFADKGCILDRRDVSYEDWTLWTALYEMVESDGYIEFCPKCYGLLDPFLTPKGKLFLLSGGYVGERRDEITSTISQFGKDVFKDALSLFVANGIDKILKINHNYGM